MSAKACRSRERHGTAKHRAHKATSNTSATLCPLPNQKLLDLPSSLERCSQAALHASVLEGEELRSELQAADRELDAGTPEAVRALEAALAREKRVVQEVRRLAGFCLRPPAPGRTPWCDEREVHAQGSNLANDSPAR